MINVKVQTFVKPCWSCKKLTTHVFATANDRMFKWEHPVKSLIHAKYGIFTPVWSKELLFTYLGSICEHCKIILGDHFINKDRKLNTCYTIIKMDISYTDMMLLEKRWQYMEDNQ